VTVPGAALAWRDLASIPRLPRMRIVRAVYVLFLLAAFLFVAGSAPLGMIGRAAFSVIASIEGAVVLAFTAILASSLIVEEREMGTEDLLRIAGVSPAGWIIGKVVPRLLEVAYAALAGIPFLAAAAVLGGVEGGEIAGLAGGLGAQIVWASALGTFVSSRARSSLAAAAWTIGALIVENAILLVIWTSDLQLARPTATPWFVPPIVWPLIPSLSAFEIHLAASAALFGAAIKAGPGGTARTGTPRAGLWIQNRRTSPAPVEDPVGWAERLSASPLRILTIGLGTCASLFCGAAAIQVASGAGGYPGDVEEFLASASLFLWPLFGLAIVLRSALAFVRDRLDGLLDLIVLTGIAPGRIVAGKVRSILAPILAPAITLGLLHLGCAISLPPGGAMLFALLPIGAGSIFMGLFIPMRISLAARSPAGAIAGSIASVAAIEIACLVISLLLATATREIEGGIVILVVGGLVLLGIGASARRSVIDRLSGKPARGT